LKVAIVHEWLITFAGSERVLEKMLEVFTLADLYVLVDFLPDSERAFLKNRNIFTSFIQKLPLAKKIYKSYLPLMPIAIEQFDLSNYDLIISSSHAVAKGVLTSPNQLHICMCYSPIRYAWDLQHQYLSESNLTNNIKGILARSLLHYIRMWDLRTSNGVDEFIAISNFIGKRIKKIYNRDSVVIYPPVDTDKFILKDKKEDFYLTVSRMVPYKKMDLIASAFSRMPDKKLIIIGDGSEFEKVKRNSAKNIELLGYKSNQVIIDYMQRAKAFIFAAEEDFGIVPLEAQACGTPVIAYNRGGSKETVINYDTDNKNATGILFNDQNVDSLINAVNYFESISLNILSENCRINALKYNPERFKKEFKEFIEIKIKQFYEK